MVPQRPFEPLNAVSILRKHNLVPRKSLGQNFLIDPAVAERIVAAAEIPEGALVLEVGPGLGALTRHLALTARRVVAVELDALLIPPLEEVLSTFENVTILQGDILKLDPVHLIEEAEPQMTGEDHPAHSYLVVANIPYNITSILIRHLLETQQKPERIVLTVQREVADRICAKPGKMSLLALSVQVYGKPQKVMRIPAGAFYPAPKVDSTTLRVDLYHEPVIPLGLMDVFFSLVKAGFSQKRKTLRNALSAGLRCTLEETLSMLNRAGIDSRRRAQTLSLEEWRALVQVYRST